MQNKNKLEEFLTSIYDDKMITVIGSAGSGKSWLTYFLCEFFILKNKSIVFIDVIDDRVVLDRLSKSENLRNRKYDFHHIRIDEGDKIINFITKIKDAVVVIDNFNSMPSKKDNIDGMADRAKTMSYMSKKLREISVANNLNIITTNNTYKSVSTGLAQIMGSSSISYISDTIVSCNKTDGEILLKVEKSRNGAYLNGESFTDMSKIIKCLIRKEKIAKLLSN
jgi:hypothetical protein